MEIVPGGSREARIGVRIARRSRSSASGNALRDEEFVDVENGNNERVGGFSGSSAHAPSPDRSRPSQSGRYSRCPSASWFLRSRRRRRVVAEAHRIPLGIPVTCTMPLCRCGTRRGGRRSRGCGSGVHSDDRKTTSGESRNDTESVRGGHGSPWPSFPRR